MGQSRLSDWSMERLQIATPTSMRLDRMLLQRHHVYAVFIHHAALMSTLLLFIESDPNAGGEILFQLAFLHFNTLSVLAETGREDDGGLCIHNCRDESVDRFEMSRLLPDDHIDDDDAVDTARDFFGTPVFWVILASCCLFMVCCCVLVIAAASLLGSNSNRKQRRRAPSAALVPITTPSAPYATVDELSTRDMSDVPSARIIDANDEGWLDESSL